MCPVEVLKARRTSQDRVQVHVALHTRRDAADGRVGTQGDGHSAEHAKIRRDAAAVTQIAIAAAKLCHRCGAGLTARKHVPCYRLSVGLVVQTVQQLIHDLGLGRAISAGGQCGRHLRRDVLALKRDVVHLGQSSVQLPKRGIGVLQVPLALLAATQAIVQHADARRLHGVIARPVHLLLRQQLLLDTEQIQVRARQMRQRHLIHQQVGNSCYAAWKCGHDLDLGRKKSESHRVRKSESQEVKLHPNMPRMNTPSSLPVWRCDLIHTSCINASRSLLATSITRAAP